MKSNHQDNLLKLADYLANLPDDYEKFDMSEYMLTRDGDFWQALDITERSKPACGTVACAVGHGPSAGIRVYGDESWQDYSDRVFGDLGADDFQYMFGSEWSNYDNTPRGAAARIRTFVSLGIAPDGWSFDDAKVLA
jgi:hypothetical protein